MTETTPINAEGLELYIDNDGILYREIWTPITTELTKQKSKGTYDHAEAAIAFRFLVGDGAWQYVKEFPDSSISEEVKQETAESMRDRFEIEHSLGNYTYLIPEITEHQKEFIETLKAIAAGRV
jgi:hypothetical protein